MTDKLNTSVSHADSHWHLTLFDHWNLSRDSTTLQLSHREQRLIAYLAIHGPRPRPVVGGELWPESSDEHAMSNLRSALLRIRQQAPGLLLGDSRDVLSLHERTTVDLTDKLEAAQRPGDPRARAQRLFPCSELLTGWYDDWVLSCRERVHHIMVIAHDLLAEELLELGDLNLALALARCAVEADPFREPSHRLLARIHLQQGDKVEAFRVYQTFRRRSIEEFGMAPTEQFDEIVATLLAERRSRRTVLNAPVAHGSTTSQPAPLPPAPTSIRG